jgi:hypothetical protein
MASVDSASSCEHVRSLATVPNQLLSTLYDFNNKFNWNWSPMSDAMLIYELVALNVALYATILLGYFLTRRIHVFKVTNLREAFEYLEVRLRRAFPDLRDGFTWNEAMTRIKRIEGNVDWIVVERVLQKYEAYRYGGVDPGNVRVDSIVKLAMMLPKGEKK